MSCTKYWAPVPDYADKYEISINGEIRNRHGRYLQPFPINSDYLRVVLYRGGYGRGFLVHRLVWLSHNGIIPAGKEMNHKNGIKTDNRIENLELVSRSENLRHAVALGIMGHATRAEIMAILTDPRPNDAIKKSNRTNQTKITAIKGFRFAPMYYLFTRDELLSLVQLAQWSGQGWSCRPAADGRMRYRAIATHYQKQTCLGIYDTPEEAHAAWLKHRRDKISAHIVATYV